MSDSSDDTAHAPTQQALVTKLADSVDSPPPRERRVSQLDLQPGQRLGNRYEVRGFLGMGGMGAVYRVFDETLGEEVALKAVRSAIAATSGLRDEVKIAQKVTHANVCRTYDLEELDGRHFVKMEYIAGETLADRIARARPGITEVIRIARGIAAGLAAAHARGIVHRDLKPGNVMLDGDRVVLMDFGLAQYAASADGDRAGTPGYMSPEQLAGMAVDQRSDLFALGCLLYEMLSGERVYGTGSMTEIEARQAELAVPDVRGKRADAPSWLARATMQLLSRDREKRPAGLALLNRGPSMRGPAIVFGLVGLVVVAGAAWMLTRRPVEWIPNTAVVRKPLRSIERVSAPSFAADGQSFVVVVDDGTDRAQTVHQVALSSGSEKELFVAPGAHEIRELRDGTGWLLGANVDPEEVWRRDRAGTSMTKLGAGEEPEDCGDVVIAIRTQPSGDTYLTWQLVAISKADGASRVLVTGEVAESFEYPRCDRAGRRVVYSSRKVDRKPGIELLELADGARPQHLVDGETPAFASDRSIVYSLDGRLFELELGSRENHPLTGEEGYFMPEVSPDGGTLVFGREDNASSVYLGGPTQPKGGYPIPLELRRIRGVLMTPDRLTLIVWRSVTGKAKSLVAIDIASGVQTELADGADPFLSHDGREVMYIPFERPTEIHAVSITGGAPRTVAETAGFRARDGYDGPDAVHLALQIVDGSDKLTGELRAVRIPHGSREMIEEGTGLVMPAPRGPWRARRIRSEVELTDGTTTRKTTCLGPPSWLDDHRFACEIRQQEIEILDVRDGRRSAIALPWPDLYAFVAADGEHWVAMRANNTVTYLAITNFAARPWAP